MIRMGASFSFGACSMQPPLLLLHRNPALVQYFRQLLQRRSLLLGAKCYHAVHVFMHEHLSLARVLRLKNLSAQGCEVLDDRMGLWSTGELVFHDSYLFGTSLLRSQGYPP